MSNKRNVVLYLDAELVKKTKELGFNLSKTFENHLKRMINLFHASAQKITTQTLSLVARRRFELLSAGPEPAMLDHYIRRKENFHSSTGLHPGYPK